MTTQETDEIESLKAEIERLKKENSDLRNDLEDTTMGNIYVGGLNLTAAHDRLIMQDT